MTHPWLGESLYRYKFSNRLEQTWIRTSFADGQNKHYAIIVSFRDY
jgi:hypothetical protein